jgi:hypothetical protein
MKKRAIHLNQPIVAHRQNRLIISSQANQEGCLPEPCVELFSSESVLERGFPN